MKIKQILPIAFGAWAFFTFIAFYFKETDKLVSDAGIYASIGMLGFILTLLSSGRKIDLFKNYTLFVGIGLLGVGVGLGTATAGQAYFEKMRATTGLSYGEKCVSIAKAEKARGYLLELLPHRASAKCYLSNVKSGPPEKVFELRNNVAMKTEFSYMRTPD